MRYLKVAVVLILLLALPIISWYYLKSGFEYQKRNVESLHNFGKTGDFVLRVENGDILESADLEGMTWVAAFTRPATTPVSIALERLIRQYDESEKFAVLVFMVTPIKEEIYLLDSLRLETVPADLQHSPAYHTALIAEEEVNKYAREVFHCPDSLSPRSTLILIDGDGQVRNFYDATDPAGRRHLAENIVLLLPRDPQQDIRIKGQEQ